MYTEKLRKEMLEMIKKGYLKADEQRLKTIALDVYEDDFSFILFDAYECEGEDLVNVIRNMIINRAPEGRFTDSDLDFTVLTEALEYSIYKIAFALIESYDPSFDINNVNYDVEKDNSLYRELIDDYSARCIWCDLEYNKDNDFLIISTNNIFGINVEAKLKLSELTDKLIMRDLLLSVLKDIISRID